MATEPATKPVSYSLQESTVKEVLESSLKDYGRYKTVTKLFKVNSPKHYLLPTKYARLLLTNLLPTTSKTRKNENKNQNA